MMSPPRLDPLPSAAAIPAPGIAAADWRDLAAELDRWAEAGRIAPLWWRDDDATAPTAALAELLRIAGGTPLALAVIPALATAELAEALRGVPACVVLQHGWRHANRATAGKKSEYPSDLPASVVAAEVGAGRDRFAALFGPRALPVFVPPWNRIAPELLPVLAGAGIAFVSTIASAKAAVPPSELPLGLGVLDVHVDLTDWKGGQRFIGEGPALGALIFWLRRCRCGIAAALRPTGILTHHMIMDRETAGFLEGLVELVAGHRGARWVDIAELLR